MEEPELPPDPFSSFLVHAEKPRKSTRSAPTNSSSDHLNPDPAPPVYDLLADGSRGESRPGQAAPQLLLDTAVPGTGASSVTPEPLPAVPVVSQRVSDGAVQELSIPGNEERSSIPGKEPPFPAAHGGQEPSAQPVFSNTTEHPRSPTFIDPEIQAQAWAILPELAMDLNLNLTMQWSEAANNIEERLQPGREDSLCIEVGRGNKQPGDGSRDAQEEKRIQDALIQSRIPASLKGKGVHVVSIVVLFLQLD